MPSPLRRLRTASLMTLLFALAIPSLASAQSTETTQKHGPGRIVKAPNNIARFNPEETINEVDATTVNVRQVLDDLGPVAKLWYQHVVTLANPFFEGRVAGTKGMEMAGEYITFHFADLGLDPAFPEAEDDDEWTSYYQPFDIATRDGPRVATVKDAAMSINGTSLKFEKDFITFGNSGSGKVDAPVTFVGYGIEEGEDGYSSFKRGTDLSGRIALMLRYEPLDEYGESRWSDKGLSSHASMRGKLRMLKELGAAGILIVTPPGANWARPGLDSLERSSRYGSSLGIPVAQIEKEVADDLLIQADAKSRDLMTMRKLADEGDITTVDLSDEYEVQLSGYVSRDVQRRSVDARNCGAVLPGKGRLADEWLIIGGHYDHVGYGQLSGAMPDNQGKLHPGADDNASGTAGVLVMSKLFADAYADAPDDADLRSVLFLAFDGEEQGLLGSRHYVNNPTLDFDQVTCMMNFDMIGNLRADSLMILGAQTAHGMEDMLESYIASSGLAVGLAPSSSGRSDEANFIRKEVPGLHFFTGMSPEYHKPADKAFTVNPGGAAKVIDLAMPLAMDLATREDMLEYTKPGERAARRTPSRAYAGVRFGIQPGMGEDLDTGILVDGVSLDTSAHDAGIKVGDILLTWDGEELAGVRSLFENLQKHKPGDKVKMTLQRDGEIIEVNVTLKGNEEEK